MFIILNEFENIFIHAFWHVKDNSRLVKSCRFARLETIPDSVGI